MPNNLPPNLPRLKAGWSWVRLGDVCEVNPKLDATKINDDVEVSFVPMKAVEELSGKVDLADERKFGKVKKGYTYFGEGDVIFAKITPCMENGKVAITTRLKNSLGFGSTEFHVLRSNDKLSNKYLFNYLIQSSYRKLAKRNMTGTAGQLRVPKRFIENSEIPLPPLSEQKKIVEKIEELFSGLDSGVASLKRAKEQVTIYRKSIFKAAFQGSLTKEWRKLHIEDRRTVNEFISDLQTLKKHYYSLQNVRTRKKQSDEIDLNIKDVESLKQGMKIPESWQWTSVGNLFDISYGLSEALTKTTPNEVNDVPIIRIPNVTEFGNLDLTKLKYFPLEGERKKKLLLKKGDVLFNWRNAPKWIGRTAVFDIDGVYINASFLLKLRPFKAGYSKFISIFLNYLRISGFFLTRVDNAVNQANFNASLLARVPIPFPSLEEQRFIIEKLNEILSELENFEKAIDDSLEKSEALRQSILKNAFEGRLV